MLVTIIVNVLSVSKLRSIFWLLFSKRSKVKTCSCYAVAFYPYDLLRLTCVVTCPFENRAVLQGDLLAAILDPYDAEDD